MFSCLICKAIPRMALPFGRRRVRSTEPQEPCPGDLGVREGFSEGEPEWAWQGTQESSSRGGKSGCTSGTEP